MDETQFIMDLAASWIPPEGMCKIGLETVGDIHDGVTSLLGKY